MNKKILIILGHANPDSFCSHLADTYAESARTAENSAESNLSALPYWIAFEALNRRELRN